jgi:tRNA uridine 5-carboxymethylaminomethyl modification enzyme
VAVDDARARLQTQRHGGVSLWALLRRPGAVYEQLPGADPVPRRVAEQLSIEARYEGYIQQELAHSRRLQDLDDWKVPETFDYTQIRGLRREACLKLGKKRPATLGQASRIDGVTPAEIALLQVHLRRLRAAGS